MGINGNAINLEMKDTHEILEFLDKYVIDLMGNHQFRNIDNCLKTISKTIKLLKEKNEL